MLDSGQAWTSTLGLTNPCCLRLAIAPVDLPSSRTPSPMSGHTLPVGVLQHRCCCPSCPPALLPIVLPPPHSLLSCHGRAAAHAAAVTAVLPVVSQTHCHPCCDRGAALLCHGHAATSATVATMVLPIVSRLRCRACHC